VKGCEQYNRFLLLVHRATVRHDIEMRGRPRRARVQGNIDRCHWRGVGRKTRARIHYCGDVGLAYGVRVDIERQGIGGSHLNRRDGLGVRVVGDSRDGSGRVSVHVFWDK